MKEYKFKSTASLILSMLLILSSHTSLGQSASIDSLKKRITEVEEAEKHRDRVLSDAIAKYEHKTDEATKDALDKIDKASQIVKLILYIGLPGSIIAMLLALLNAKKRLKKYFEEKVTETINQKWETLKKMMDSHDDDDRLRKEKKITILSASDPSNTQIRNIIKKFGFKHTSYQVVTQYVNFGQTDLIVFNNINGDFSSDLIRDFVMQSPESVYFVTYTSGQAERHNRANFANTQYTLFNAIFGTLKYAEIINS